jgi:hypothetical protein
VDTKYRQNIKFKADLILRLIDIIIYKIFQLRHKSKNKDCIQAYTKESSSISPSTLKHKTTTYPLVNPHFPFLEPRFQIPIISLKLLNRTGPKPNRSRKLILLKKKTQRSGERLVVNNNVVPGVVSLGLKRICGGPVRAT